MMKVTIQARLLAGIRYDADTKGYVSFTPALNLYSAGRTEEEARAAIESAVRLHLLTAYEHGMLERVLKKGGFEPATTPADVAAEDQFLAILRRRDFSRIFEVNAPLELQAVA